MQSNTEIIVLEGASGSKTIGTIFTPVQLIFYNNSDAILYVVPGRFNTLPQNTVEIPAQSYWPVPFTENIQAFTVFWEYPQPPSELQKITVFWSDVSVPSVPSLLQQPVIVTNTPNVVIDTSGGPVTMSGTVSLASGTTVGISGTATVSGSVSVSNTPNVVIDTSGGAVAISGTVSLASGTAVGVSGTATVAGSVSVTNTVTTTIDTSGGPVDVSGSVTFPSAQEVTLASTGPVDVQNLVLSNTNAVYFGKFTYTVTNLAAGSSVTFFPENQNAIGTYDGFLFIVQTETQASNSYIPALANAAAIDLGYLGGTGYGRSPNVAVASAISNWSQDTYWQLYYQATLTNPYTCDNTGINLTNNTGATISDTINIWVWGLKAQITNPVANPAQMQPAVGEFGTQINSGNNAYELTTVDTAVVIANSGTPPYIKMIKFTAWNGTSTAVAIQLMLGTVAIAFYNLTAEYANGSSISDTFLFPDAIPFSSDISAECTHISGGGTACAVAVTILIEGVSSAAQIVPTTN